MFSPDILEAVVLNREDIFKGQAKHI